MGFKKIVNYKLTKPEKLGGSIVKIVLGTDLIKSYAIIKGRTKDQEQAPRNGLIGTDPTTDFPKI